MVQRYWTPKNRPAITKIIASSFFFAFVVEVYPNVSPRLAMVFGKLHGTSIPKCVGERATVFAMETAHFPVADGSAEFWASGWHQFPKLILQNSGGLQPVHWLTTKKNTNAWNVKCDGTLNTNSTYSKPNPYHVCMVYLPTFIIFYR